MAQRRSGEEYIEIAVTLGKTDARKFGEYCKKIDVCPLQPAVIDGWSETRMSLHWGLLFDLSVHCCDS